MRVDIIFTPEQVELVKQNAKELGVKLREGFNGPNFYEVLNWGFSQDGQWVILKVPPNEGGKGTATYYYPAKDISRVKVYEEGENV